VRPGASVEVRAVAPGDLAAWLPLWEAYQRFYQVELGAEATRTTWSRLLEPIEPVHGALLWDAGRAAGLAHWITHRSTWSTGNECYLNDLFVDPASRRRGHARRLIEFAAAAARDAGCGQMYWLTHQSNQTAIKLYETMAERTGFIDFRIRF
jgi:GNAT superfamily N-acetyltransferase